MLMYSFAFICVKKGTTNEEGSATEKGKVFKTLSSYAAHHVGLQTMHVYFLGEGQGFSCLEVAASRFIYAYFRLLSDAKDWQECPGQGPWGIFAEIDKAHYALRL